jgi:hypothetical protein
MQSLQSLLEGLLMATMTIRNLDDDLKARLRLRAARHGQSMEEGRAAFCAPRWQTVSKTIRARRCMPPFAPAWNL